MNTKDRFNAMVDLIEKEVQNEYPLDEDQILTKLIKLVTLDERILREIFKFILGKTIREYIRERRMMKAYSHLIEPQPDMQTAIELSGKGDQSSFIKDFKKRFGITPTQAISQKDPLLLKGPLYWDVISDNNHDVEEYGMETETSSMLKYGIECEKLQRYNETLNLQARYDFSESETELAFQFAQDQDISLAEAFKLIDAGIEAQDRDDMFEPFFDTTEPLESEKHLSLQNECIISYASQLNYLLKKTKLSFKEADLLVFKLQKWSVDVRKEPLEMILLFKGSQNSFFSYGEFKSAYEESVDETLESEEWMDEIDDGIDDYVEPPVYSEIELYESSKEQQMEDRCKYDYIRNDFANRADYYFPEDNEF